MKDMAQSDTVQCTLPAKHTCFIYVFIYSFVFTGITFLGGIAVEPLELTDVALPRDLRVQSLMIMLWLIFLLR